MTKFAFTVDNDLAPQTNNTRDIGLSNLKFKDINIAGDGSVGGDLTITGNIAAANLSSTSTGAVTKNEAIAFAIALG
tara:strand:+ start:508 stop:738 length:231 start_codon:yes stop_codon:yes gene_type:complete